MCTIFCFWKGTPIVYDFENLDNYNKLVACGNEMIIKELRDGHSLKELICTYCEQLNILEKRLYDTFGNNIYNYSDINKIISKSDKVIWFLNVSALLKFKIIDNDEMNGFMIIDN